MCACACVHVCACVCVIMWAEFSEKFDTGLTQRFFSKAKQLAFRNVPLYKQPQKLMSNDIPSLVPKAFSPQRLPLAVFSCTANDKHWGEKARVRSYHGIISVCERMFTLVTHTSLHVSSAPAPQQGAAVLTSLTRWVASTRPSWKPW